MALLVAVICWYFGADVWHSILLGAALTAVGLIGMVGTTAPVLGSTDWRSGGRPNRHGARSDVAELSWSLRGSYGRVDRSAVRRMQQLARQRLALHNLDLLNPDDRHAIEQLIGRGTYAVLVHGALRRPPLLSSFVRCLDALDALDPRRPVKPPLQSRRRSPTLALSRLRRARER
jgi:hypothetical protein